MVTPTWSWPPIFVCCSWRFKVGMDHVRWLIYEAYLFQNDFWVIIFEVYFFFFFLIKGIFWVTWYLIIDRHEWVENGEKSEIFYETKQHCCQQNYAFQKYCSAGKFCPCNFYFRIDILYLELIFKFTDIRLYLYFASFNMELENGRKETIWDVVFAIRIHKRMH